MGTLCTSRRRAHTGLSPVSPNSNGIIAQKKINYNIFFIRSIASSLKICYTGKTHKSHRQIGMGKSQRYQAAVDGQKSRLFHWHRLRRNRHYGVRSRHTNCDWTRKTLGDGLAVLWRFFARCIFSSPNVSTDELPGADSCLQPFSSGITKGGVSFLCDMMPFPSAIR